MTETAVPGADETAGAPQADAYARGARILSIGIASTGIFTFAYFAVASHVLDASAYGAISCHKFKPKNMTDDIFLAQILGHKLLGPNAALSVGQSYKDFYIRGDSEIGSAHKKATLRSESAKIK